MKIVGQKNKLKIPQMTISRLGKNVQILGK